MNSFGNIYRLTTFGESHGRAVGGVIDGMPARVIVDLRRVQEALDRRRPGRSRMMSARNEADRLQILSGVMGYDRESGEIMPLADDSAYGITLGSPIGFMVENRDCRPSDYESMRHVYRPSHADFTTDMRYGIRDWRGGGRSSARETLARVVGGAFAAEVLRPCGVGIRSRIVSVGNVVDGLPEEIENEIMKARREGDSVGGVVECVISGMPAGVGEPVFGKLQQMLAGAMMSIGAVKGFEYGMGFGGVRSRGSDVADCFVADGEGKISTATNNSGGIQGGISNGMDVVMRLAVKPTPTIGCEMATVTDSGEPTVIKAGGRHDPCILPRILPVVEAMGAMVILDAMMIKNAIRQL